MKGVPYSISSQRLSGASYPCSADLIPSQGPSISLGYIQNNATCGDYERREFTITLPDGVPEVDMSLVLACADLTVKQPVTITSGAPVARHRRKRDMSQSGVKVECRKLQSPRAGQSGQLSGQPGQVTSSLVTSPGSAGSYHSVQSTSMASMAPMAPMAPMPSNQPSSFETRISSAQFTDSLSTISATPMASQPMSSFTQVSISQVAAPTQSMAAGPLPVIPSSSMAAVPVTVVPSSAVAPLSSAAASAAPQESTAAVTDAVRTNSLIVSPSKTQSCSCPGST